MGNAAFMQMMECRLLKTAPQKVSPIYIGAWIATPGYIRDQANQLGVTATALQSAFNKNIQYMIENNIDHTDVGNFQQTSVDPLVNEILSFVNDHQGWTDNLWGSELDTIKEYQKRLQAVYDLAVRNGYGGPISDIVRPEVSDYSVDIPNPITPVWDFIKKIVYIAVGVGIVVLFVFLVGGR
jgi:hypothetical protein